MWHNSDVTWGSRCLNSLTSWLFVQNIVQAKNYNNTKLHTTEFYEGNLPSCGFPQWYVHNSLGNCFVPNRQQSLKQYGPSHLKHMVSLSQNELNTVVSYYHQCHQWRLKITTIRYYMAQVKSGPRLNIKTVLSTYGDFHVKDKTAVRTSYL